MCGVQVLFFDRLNNVINQPGLLEQKRRESGVSSGLLGAGSCNLFVKGATARHGRFIP